ncbi:MAG: hypothetical protein AAB400_02250 [Patescibacteria group bacterium]
MNTFFQKSSIGILVCALCWSGVQSTDAQTAFHFSSSKQTVRELRETTVLRWDATALDADYCEASGFWKGKKALRGTQEVRPWLDGNYYALKCVPKDSNKKPVTLTVTIDVDKDVLPEYGGFPAIDFSADSLIIEEGGSAKLTWDAQGADYCYGYHSTAPGSQGDIRDEWSEANGLDPKGSIIIHPRASGRYQISCTLKTKSTNYSNSESISITVGPKKPTIVLTASKQSVERGSSVDLSWNAPGAQKCYSLAYIPNKDGYFAQVDFTSSWYSQSLPIQGSITLTPLFSTQYYLNCTWKDGERGSTASQRAVAKVAVTNYGRDLTPPAIPIHTPTIMSFFTEPISVFAGEKVFAAWKAFDAERCSFVSYALNSLGGDDVKKQLPIEGSGSFTPLKSGRYGISCTAETYVRDELGLDFATTARDEEWEDIVVITPEDLKKKREEQAKALTITFSTDKEIVAKGKTAYFTWDAVNATSCVAKGPAWWKSGRASRGSFEIKPEYTAKHQLECINDTVSPPIKRVAELAITVVPANAPSWLLTNPTQKPFIEFKVDKTTVEKKKAVTFSWIASYAESCRGEGAAAGWKGKKKPTGSHILYLQADYEVTQPYRLICSNRNGTVTSQDIRLSFAKKAKKK